MLPDLPPEIEDKIFEYAAHMHPKYAPTLSIVSKRVQTCVERIIYEKLHLFPARSELPWPRSAEGASIQLFRRTLRRRSTEFFATHVRSVIFQNDVEYSSAKLVLEKCIALEHLAFFVQPEHPQVSDASHLIFPSAHTLRSLMTTRDVFADMAESGIVCPRLWYLWICGPYKIRMPALNWLPALHTVDLLLYKDPCLHTRWKDDVETIMSTTRKLQVIGLYVHEKCSSRVERWRERVSSTVRIDLRVDLPFGVVERWRMLTSSNVHSMLEISDIRGLDEWDMQRL